MKKRSAAFIFVDVLLIILMILPIAGLITLYILTTPASEGIQITGARIYFTLDTPIQPFPITESQVNSLAVVLVVFWFCLFITHGIKSKPTTRRQLIAEWIVETTGGLFATADRQIFSGVLIQMRCSAFPSTSRTAAVMRRREAPTASDSACAMEQS